MKWKNRRMFQLPVNVESPWNDPTLIERIFKTPNSFEINGTHRRNLMNCMIQRRITVYFFSFVRSDWRAYCVGGWIILCFHFIRDRHIRQSAVLLFHAQFNCLNKPYQKFFYSTPKPTIYISDSIKTNNQSFISRRFEKQCHAWHVSLGRLVAQYTIWMRPIHLWRLLTVWVAVVRGDSIVCNIIDIVGVSQ